MRLQAASLRLGSQGLKTSFDDHLLIIGDAAGHIDPLTGEGIHTAIMARGRTCRLIKVLSYRACTPSQWTTYRARDPTQPSCGDAIGLTDRATHSASFYGPSLPTLSFRWIPCQSGKQ